MEGFHLERIEYDSKSPTAKARISYDGEVFSKNVEKPRGSVLSPEDLAKAYVYRANKGLENIGRNGETVEDFFEKCEKEYLDSIVRSRPSP